MCKALEKCISLPHLVVKNQTIVQICTVFQCILQLQAALETSLWTLSHFGKYLNHALGLCVLSEKEYAMNGALNEKLKR